MDWNWKVLINLLVALVFFAAALYLMGMDSYFAVGKRNPGMGRVFAGTSLQLLIAALLSMAAFALSWVWRLARGMSVGFLDNVFGVILLLVAVICLISAFQKGERVRTPGAPPPPASSESVKSDKPKP